MPKFLVQELGRQEDIEQIREKIDNSGLIGSSRQDRTMMGPNARARYHTIDAFSYKPEEIMKRAKESETLPLRLDKDKIKRIKEIEKNHFTRNYCRKGNVDQSALPDYLRPF